MDLFLMDLILKEKIPQNAQVLDVGCGEGRNGIYFIQNGYEYTGIDTDESKLRLVEYLSRSITPAKARFKTQDLLQADSSKQYDFIICSRVLHFAESSAQFLKMWEKLKSLLRVGGGIYVSMDSVVDTQIGKPLAEGKHEFPDTKTRFVLTEALYEVMKKGFEEIEPLRTWVQHNERAQSFLILRKV